MTRQKLLPPTYFFLTSLLMIVIHFLVPIFRIIHFPWTLLGFIPAIIGIAMNIIADNAFKQRNTTVKPFRESSALLTDGLFRFTRNPMYLGFVLILLGIAIFLGSILPFLIAITFIVVIYRTFIQVEEKMLEETFGEEWQAYKKRVRRWI
jgi:protein-S-isoprenylcysteine O-methyltransferase Ste14